MILKCCICNKKFEGYGHNPRPIKEKGLCCDKCDNEVTRERLKLWGIDEDYVLQVIKEKVEGTPKTLKSRQRLK